MAFDKIIGYKKLFELSQNSEPLDIFTLNNDLLMEWLGKKFSSVVDDGVSMQESQVSVPNFSNKLAKIRLYKLHGSLNWRRSLGSNTVRKIERKQSFIGSLFSDGHIAETTADTPLIWPGVYDEFNDPLAELRAIHFRNAIVSTKKILIAGYNFGDSELVNIFLEAIQRNPQAAVHFVVGKEAESDFDSKLKVFLEKLRECAPNVSLKLKLDEHTRYFPKCLSDRTFFSELAVNSYET